MTGMLIGYARVPPPTTKTSPPKRRAPGEKRSNGRVIDMMRLNAASSGGRTAKTLGVYYTDSRRAIMIHNHSTRPLEKDATPLLDEPMAIFSRVVPSVEAGYWCARVVSPTALPFALPGKSARRDHALLRDVLLSMPDGLRPGEHPLG